MFVELLKDFLGRKPGERIDVSEADAQALIQAGTARAVPGDPLAETISRAIGDALGKLTQGLDSAVDTALQEFAKAQGLARKNAVPRIFGAGGEGDPKKTFGRFLLAVRAGDRKALEEMGSRHVDWAVDQKAALNTQTGAQGGYTVPADFLPNLLMLSAEMGIVEKRATRIPMSGRSVQVPALDVTTAPASGDSAFFGGLVARWTEEASTLNEAEPQFKQIELVAHELSGYTLASNTLLADNAVGLEAMLRQLFARALAWHKDHAFLRGNGAGKPLGVLNANALISVTRSAGNAFALADAAGMLGRLLPGWTRQNTVWAIHPTVLVKLFQMSESGTGSDLMVIDRGSEAPTMSLLGIPVEVTEKLPGLGTLGDVLLMDLKHYLVGDRQDVEIAYSEHVKFLTNQGAWRFVCRGDGQPWLRSTITLADATNTLSPFVGLAA